MTDEFDEFDDPRMGNPWLRYGILCLNLIGAVYVLIGLVLGPLYGWIFSQDAGVVVGIVVGLVLAVISIGMAIANFVAGALLTRKSKIGWVLGLIMAGLYVSSCCVPFSVVIFVGLLNDKSRKIYLG